MAWPWLAIIAKTVPWVELARRAPDILAKSRELLEESRKRSAPVALEQPTLDDLRRRIEVLEQRDTEHARLLAAMVAQLEGLTEAVRVLTVRNKLVAILGTVVALVLVAVIVSLRPG